MTLRFSFRAVYDSENANQLWIFIELENIAQGTYMICNINQSTALAHNGLSVIMKSIDTGDPQQHWMVTMIGDGCVNDRYITLSKARDLGLSSTAGLPGQFDMIAYDPDDETQQFGLQNVTTQDDPFNIVTPEMNQDS